MGRPDRSTVRSASVVRVFFVSDSTGISAETMGNALLLQFPDLVVIRKLMPFIDTVDKARRVASELDEAAAEGLAVAFSTAANADIRRELFASVCPTIDFFEQHVHSLESIFSKEATRHPGRLHGVGNAHRYNARIAAAEYAMEHDDGTTVRALDRADVILLAPSRCGKTPTTMYLALQHGVFAANYPLVPDDLEVLALPVAVRKLRSRCFGILTTPARLSLVRNERRPASVYSSVEQCAWELKRAELMFRSFRIPTVDSSAKSVEEMSSVILQYLNRA